MLSENYQEENEQMNTILKKIDSLSYLLKQNLDSNIITKEHSQFTIFKIFIPSIISKPINYSREANLEIYEDVDPSKFNFNKINKDEILKTIRKDQNCDDAIIMNIYAFIKSHMLILPFYNGCDILPQYIENYEILERVLSIYQEFKTWDTV